MMIKLHFHMNSNRQTSHSRMLALLNILLFIIPFQVNAGSMILSNRDQGLAINAWNGAQHGTVLRLHNGCQASNPDCTWTFSNGMLISNRDPSLAINAWGGAQHGTELKLHNGCQASNPDCTWTFSGGSGGGAQAFITRDAERDFGSGKHAKSHAGLDRSSGILTVTTETWTNSPFQGFTMGMKVWGVDKFGTIAIETQGTSYGVDGTSVPFGGPSQRIDPYRKQEDLAKAAQTENIYILLYHAPRNRIADIINQAGQETKKITDAINNFCQLNQDVCDQVKEGLVSQGAGL